MKKTEREIPVISFVIFPVVHEGRLQVSNLCLCVTDSDVKDDESEFGVFNLCLCETDSDVEDDGSEFGVFNLFQVPVKYLTFKLPITSSNYHIIMKC
ncbi:hypothetical protein NPIL_317741 [Nephila pilipes]|uniref:Uncharacterized protein n=1 Tax=Nephila pilipes TaxID=299642 RepID=A0A8X6P2J4_NEPPI|nr:hypothetical protein NPIL_317741 [Nephila pilipes]